MAKADGWKAKQWYSIVAPDMMGKAVIGETFAEEPEKVIGRVIEATLGEITNDLSKQNIKMLFKIDKIGGDTAYTKFIGHQLTQDYLRSLVKRHTSCIEATIDVVTSDGHRMRIKPSCFTIKRAKATQVTAIRKIMIDVVVKRARELDMAQFIQEIIQGKLAASIYRDSKIIYPLRRVEIRRTEVIGEPGSAS